jgi:putative pyrroloquinoline-quinone binding quinoprotein
MRALVIFTVMLLSAACAPLQPATSTTKSTVTAVPMTPVRGTTPAWRYALPPRWDISQVRIGDTAVVIGGRSDVRVLDPASGRLRWQRDGSASAIVLTDTVVYGGATGTVASLALSNGRVLWERRAVCPIPTDGAPVGGVAVIVRHADDLIVGCNGGRLVRISAASGRIRARSESAFVAERIWDIVPLGSCAYGINGSSSGATIRQHAAILDCKRLRVIVPEQDEMQILGSIGNIAVLDERCCNGPPNVYRPATIVRANLTTGALSPAVDLTPEPNRYPPDRIGSAAMLDGNELYLIVDRSLYRYGDPRSLSASPQRIAADLADFPMILRHGLLAVRLRVDGGSITDEIVRIRNGALEPRWSSRESGPVILGYHADMAPDVLTIGNTILPRSQTFVRTYDGAQLFVTGPCQMWGANRDLVLMVCTTDTLVGNRYLEYVAAYRWHDTAPR